MSRETLDLLIVGSGPAGLLASIMASQLGLSHEVIEQRGGLHTEPSAHVLKTHSMEVYRRVGVADEIAAQSTPVELQRCITWAESVGGLTYGRLSLVGKKGPVPRFTRISPVFSCNLPQSVLEPMLHRRAIEAAGRDPVAFGTPFQGYREDAGEVVATVGREEAPREIRARYLIGADGAGSTVRRAAGIAMEGPQALAHFLAVHINSDVRPFLDRNPGVLFFLRTPTLEGFFIMHQPVGSQVFMMRFDPEATPFETFDEAACRRIIEEAMGVSHAFTISAIDRWNMSAQIAATYRTGRVVLVGDAGHRFPPTGGLGLNTGVEDVENVLWKLAAVLRGQADPALLDSYETECRPIAIRNSNQSVSNHLRMSEVAEAIGANDGPDGFADAIAELHADPDHPRFATIQAAIDDQVAHFAFLELEMAATAEAGAFVPADRPIARPVPAVEGFEPSFTPGSHVPHLWLEPGVATIDVLRFDRFTLFVPATEADAWREAAGALPQVLLPVTVYPLDEGIRGEQASVAEFWGDEPYAVLVRPDGRVAWVEPRGMTDRREALLAAVTAVTGTPLNETEFA